MSDRTLLRVAYAWCPVLVVCIVASAYCFATRGAAVNLVVGVFNVVVLLALARNIIRFRRWVD